MTLHFSPYVDVIKSKPERRNAAVKSSTGPYRNTFKRALDIVLTLLSFPVVLPVVGLMALLIALDGHNPFYTQRRIGKGGRVFRMWKLRTMVHNADDLLEAYLADNPAARQEWDSTQKLKLDPRITFAGRFLRKTSMDELPQLWNVLNGTMSLVGPRPMMVCQQDDYLGQGYYRLRPGITGTWQVSDRNQCNFTDRVRYDDLYDQTMSFRTDLSILLRTVLVVLRGTGY